MEAILTARNFGKDVFSKAKKQLLSQTEHFKSNLLIISHHVSVHMLLVNVTSVCTQM